MINFDHVTKRYPGSAAPAVNDLDLEMPDGQTMVLVGPSGCGKTTSLRMINRMIDLTEGRILLDGRDIQQTDPAKLRRGIGYVIQHAGLFPHRTIEDNIATVPLLVGWTRKKARDRARELMDLVSLDPALARRYPHQLSGGQQQRVGVARALAADPPVLLMDEPFSAVGFDRGIRRLSFFPASALDLETDTVVPDQATAATARAVAKESGQPWLLVVDAQRLPRGWVSAAALEELPASATLAQAPLAGWGHTFRVSTDSLRAALDATVLSPTSRAAGVDDDGRVVGVTSYDRLRMAIHSSQDAADPADDPRSPRKADPGDDPRSPRETDPGDDPRSPREADGAQGPT